MSDDTSYYFYRRAASYVHISKLIPALAEGETKLSDIRKQINMTYANLTQVMQDAHKEGLIDRKRVNNSWNFNMTEKGNALCELCKGISAVIEHWDGENTLKYLRSMKFGDEEEVVGTKANNFDVIRKSGGLNEK
jgi:predicted transcriptional regulator